MAAVIQQDNKVKPKKAKTLDFTSGVNCVFTSWDIPREPTWDEKTMKYLVFQEEKCPTTGKLHWQGYVEFLLTTRLKRAKELLGLTGGWNAQKRLASAWQAAEYCKKADSATGRMRKEYGLLPEKDHKGPGHRTDLQEASAALKAGASMKELAEKHTSAMVKYHKGFEVVSRLLKKEVKMPDPGITLYPWQIEVLKITERGFKKRQIIWIWSEKSATGKSTFCDYLVFKYGITAVLPGSFKKDDLLYAYDEHKIVTFNIPRGHVMNDTNFAVLESISDGGYQLSTKYETRGKMIASVVIVFANIPPPETRLPMRCIDFCVDSEITKKMNGIE